MWRIQRMFSRMQTARGFAEALDLETLHAKGLHHAIAAERFLQDLVQFAEARLAGFDRAADAAAELATPAAAPWARKSPSPASSSSW